MRSQFLHRRMAPRAPGRGERKAPSRERTCQLSKELCGISCGGRGVGSSEVGVHMNLLRIVVAALLLCSTAVTAAAAEDCTLKRAASLDMTTSSGGAVNV